jgi:hypothetical protein|tara:strand:+ start:97 stop:543 length:447 start_codon:yes stop_codon:yes gene_type:complete
MNDLMKSKEKRERSSLSEYNANSKYEWYLHAKKLEETIDKILSNPEGVREITLEQLDWLETKLIDKDKEIRKLKKTLTQKNRTIRGKNLVISKLRKAKPNAFATDNEEYLNLEGKLRYQRKKVAKLEEQIEVFETIISQLFNVTVKKD